MEWLVCSTRGCKERPRADGLNRPDPGAESARVGERECDPGPHITLDLALVLQHRVQLNNLGMNVFWNQIIKVDDLILSC